MAVDAHEVLVHPDGAEMAYEIYGQQYVGQIEPIVLIGGMSSLRQDWERLSHSLAKDRPVLIFDHRGMGDSSFSPAGGETITIELMARDLLDLLTFLDWKEVAICGFSMGGVIAQQLLFLPFLTNDPTSLPFRITHVFLTGTLADPLRLKGFGLKVAIPAPLGRPRTREEKIELIRPTLESSFDPNWISNPANSKRLNWWLDRMIVGRPSRTIMMQARTLVDIKFDDYYPKLSGDIQVLVIHGKLDEVVPFSCASDILQRIPWAKMVEIGSKSGQVKDLEFGHHWFEYFDVQMWHNVITRFLHESPIRQTSRL